MGININAKWFGIGLKLAAVLPGAVAAVERAFHGPGRGEEKMQAVKDAAAAILQASESVADRDFANDDEVLGAVESLTKAIVHLNNLIAAKSKG